MATAVPVRTPMVKDAMLRVVRNPVVRGSVVRLADRAIWEFLRRTDNPPGVARDEWLTLRGLMYSFHRALRKGQVSDQAWRRFAEFARHRLGRNPVREAFKEKYGDYPPGFLAISPTRACNLNCIGCYAGTEDRSGTLSFAAFDRILREMKELWGASFVVLSGGEPFLYRSDDKDLLDIAGQHLDMYFLVYTNGTLIDEKTARRMGELGNVTPAISVEGKVATTEERRGKGVFGEVMGAFRNLRTAGVPFGISMTATRENCEELLSDEVVEFYFEEQGALYGWIFQYMPIGKGYDLSLMITPEQRLRLQRRMWEVIKEKKVFLMEVPFFAEIRSWQKGYGYKTKPQETKNLILPCPHRDHFDFLLSLIERHRPKPINREAERALVDPTYVQGLREYGRACAEILDPVWNHEYLRGAMKGDEVPELEPVAQGQRSGAGAQ